MTDGVGYRPVLPRPSSAYKEAEQQNNRVNIQFALDHKLNRNESAVFGGIPYFIVKGTSTSFSVPAGTNWTKIPGSVLYKKTDPGIVLDEANNTFSPLVTSDMEFKASLDYIGGGNGQSAQIYVGVFADGVLMRQGASSCLLEADVYVPANFILLNMDPAKKYDVRVRHGENTAVLFNLANSYWGTTRMSSLVMLKTP